MRNINFLQLHLDSVRRYTHQKLRCLKKRRRRRRATYRRTIWSRQNEDNSNIFSISIEQASVSQAEPIHILFLRNDDGQLQKEAALSQSYFCRVRPRFVVRSCRRRRCGSLRRDQIFVVT